MGDDDHNHLRDLAERLLGAGQPVPGGRPQAVQLLVGQLPEGLPVEVAVPPGGRVLGSAVRRVGEQVTFADVVLEVQAPAATALAAYGQELAARGWQPAPSPIFDRGGFQPARVAESATFCQGRQGPWLSVTAVGPDGGPSDVRLHLDLVNPGPCAQEALGQPRIAAHLPPLHAPAGVPLESRGGGGSNDRWTVEAAAETDRAAAELEAHFARQLAAAGWTRLVGGADGPLAWSLWQVTGEAGEAWQGLLLVLEAPGSARRSLHLRIESLAPLPGRPWVSSG